MYTQLNLRTNSASQISQNIISEQIRNIPGTIKICDDNNVMVFGQTQADHNKALQAVFERFSTVDFRRTRQGVNQQANTDIFWGVSCYQGITLNSMKVQAIHGTYPPTSVVTCGKFHLKVGGAKSSGNAGQHIATILGDVVI